MLKVLRFIATVLLMLVASVFILVFRLVCGVAYAAWKAFSQTLDDFLEYVFGV